MCPLPFRVPAGGEPLSSWTADSDAAAAAAGSPGQHELQAKAHRDYRSAFLQRTGGSGFD